MYGVAELTGKILTFFMHGFRNNGMLRRISWYYRLIEAVLYNESIRCALFFKKHKIQHPLVNSALLTLGTSLEMTILTVASVTCLYIWAHLWTIEKKNGWHPFLGFWWNLNLYIAKWCNWSLFIDFYISTVFMSAW